MDLVIVFIHTYIGEIVAAMQIVLVVLISIVLLQVNATRKKVMKITSAVQQYLAVVMNDDANDLQHDVNTMQHSEGCSVSAPTDESMKEEEQNRLISAVLQEIFP
jgi:hypothetical protein